MLGLVCLRLCLLRKLRTPRRKVQGGEPSLSEPGWGQVEQVERPGPPRSASPARTQPGRSTAEIPRLAAGAGSRPDGGGWEPGRRPAELTKPGTSESAGCPAPGSLPLAVCPRRAPVSPLTHTRPPAAARLGVAAIPPSPTAFPSPGPHSPPLRRSPHLPQLLSLPDWPSRDLMPISQSPPLAGPRLTSERLAAAWGRAQERRAEGVSALPPPLQPRRLPFRASVRTRGAQ